ncbi:MAG TPA: Gfo/Idh/MocA family oxidoreductase [Mycobacteriales bacterium]|jgi:predicted dehydrogenase|nr:Gfo/Idh/MocA family oxidoreductase [Mycobacteriales bacterium]
MIRVAMLSFWHVHARDYARQATEHPGVEIVAAWDEDAARGRARAEELKVPFHDNLEELLKDPEIDGVIVDTPSNVHPEVITAAARAGKHIFTEKVLALTLTDAEAILAEVRKAGVSLVLSLPRLYDGYTQAVQKVIASGDLGQITLVRVRLSHNGAVGEGWLPAHFFDPIPTGGGAMVDLGCHPMYLNRLFGGLPESVQASYGHITGRAVEDNAVAVLRYPNGQLGIAEAGFSNRHSPFTIEVHGTEGSLLYGTPEAKLLVRTGDAKEWSEVEIPGNEPSAFTQWVQHVENGSWATDNVDIGLDLTRLMDAANRSATSGSAVSLNSLS